MSRTTINFLLVAASIATIVGYLVIVQDRLPIEVATHWGAGGEADGFTSRAALPFVFGGMAAFMGALFSVIATTAPQRAVAGVRLLQALPLALVWFIGGLAVITILPQLDGGDASTLPDSAIAVALGLGLIGGLIGAWAAGPPATVPSTTARPDASAPRIPLASGHTAVWSGRTPTGKAVPIIGAGVGILGLVIGFAAGWGVSLILIPVAWLLVASSTFNVTVGPNGIRVAALGLGVPRVTIPLSQVESVEAGTVDAWEYGGWGIRLGKDTAVITRSGPALVVNRTDGAALRVSLDNPAEPVAVMNSLMDRRA